MQVLDRGIFLKLKEMDKSRGVTVQELIRVLVIPDWMRKSQEEIRSTDKRRRHRRLAGPGRSPVPAGGAGGAGGGEREGFGISGVWVGEAFLEWRAFFFFSYIPGGG